MAASVVLFLVGFYILIKGANYLVDGASAIARIFHVSNWLIGVVIVGIGTSIPELSINIASSFGGSAIGVGTVIGSNIYNILFIIGISALVTPLALHKEWVREDFVFTIAATVIAGFALYLPMLGDSAFHGITFEEALLLLVLFLIWLVFSIMRKENDPDLDIKVLTLTSSIVMIVAGFIGVFLGGGWVVGGAEKIAGALGASPLLVGLTVVSIGTSIPELVVSVLAAFRKRPGIAVGNVIGSSIFDFLGIFGMAGLIRPIATPAGIGFDTLLAVFAPIILLVAVFAGMRYTIARWQGALFVGLYCLYFVFIIVRG